jgi:hypothetical protein
MGGAPRHRSHSGLAGPDDERQARLDHICRGSTKCQRQMTVIASSLRREPTAASRSPAPVWRSELRPRFQDFAVGSAADHRGRALLQQESHS